MFYAINFMNHRERDSSLKFEDASYDIAFSSTAL